MLPWHFIPRNHDNFIDPTKYDQKVLVTRGNLGGMVCKIVAAFMTLSPYKSWHLLPKKPLLTVTFSNAMIRRVTNCTFYWFLPLHKMTFLPHFWLRGLVIKKNCCGWQGVRRRIIIGSKMTKWLKGYGWNQREILSRLSLTWKKCHDNFVTVTGSYAFL